MMTETAPTDWLAELKEGDAVIVARWGQPDEILPVRRATPKFVTVGSVSFRRRDGKTTGQNATHLKPVTAAAKAQEGQRNEQHQRD